MSEATAGGDSTVGTYEVDVTVQEQVTGSDSLNPSAIFVASLVEGGVVDDQSSAAAQFLATVIELAQASEAFVASLLWELINDSQTAEWQPISGTNPDATWATVNGFQAGAWENIPNQQTVNWQNTSTADGTAWDVIPTNP